MLRLPLLPSFLCASRSLVLLLRNENERLCNRVNELRDKVTQMAEIYPIALDLSEEEALDSCARALINSEAYAGQFKVLKKFVADKPKWEHLELIPCAMSMYRWINNTLQNMITEEDAQNTPLYQLVEKYMKHCKTLSTMTIT